MKTKSAIVFAAAILKLGINPCVNIPRAAMQSLFRQSGKEKGPIPVHGTLNGCEFRQTVVRYRGAWRLYLNAPMRREAGIDVGDTARVRMQFDPRPRTVPMHPRLQRALAGNAAAHKAFQNLIPSRQKEILRYLHSMKTAESIERNVRKVMKQLTSR